MPSTHFTVNQTPSSHGVAMYQLFAGLIAAGWTVVSSSDGTTSGSGQRFHSGATGADGWFNNGAWIVLQQPSGNVSPYSGTRQMMFQNNGSNGIRWTYSRTAGYTGGSATVSPSATDEVYSVGGGSPASPQYYAWINTSAPGYRCEVMADDGTSGTAFPFGWYMVCFINGGSGANAGFFMDPVTSYETGDADPFVFGTAVANSTAFTVVNDLCASSSAGGITDGTKAGANMGFMHTWQNAAAVNLLPATWAGVQGLCLSEATSVIGPSNMGTSPVTGNDVCVPIVWGRLATRSGVTGWKGVSMMLRYRAANRSTGSTVSIASAGAKEFVVMGDVVWPWNGTAVTV